jgi:hypothetical protein
VFCAKAFEVKALEVIAPATAVAPANNNFLRSILPHCIS